jgi:hypothetical protein
MRANPNWSEDFSKKENIAAREMFASATGKIDQAFADKYGAATAYGTAINEKAAKNYIQGLNAKEIGSVPLAYARDVEKDGKTVSETVKNEESLRLIGEHILATQMASMRNEINGTQRLLIMEGIHRSNNEDSIEFMNASPAWAKNLEKMQKNLKNIEASGKATGQRQTDILKSQDEKLKTISTKLSQK